MNDQEREEGWLKIGGSRRLWKEIRLTGKESKCMEIESWKRHDLTLNTSKETSIDFVSSKKREEKVKEFVQEEEQLAVS